MATLKLTLDKRRKYGDGSHPLIFRLTSNKKSTSIHLGIKLFKNEWDSKRLKIKSVHPNSKQLNIELRKVQSNHELRLIKIVKEEKVLNLINLKEKLLNKDENKPIKFTSFVEQQINSLNEQSRFGNAESYRTASNRLIGFTGKSLTLNQISYKLIKKFVNHLSVEGISKNSIAVYLRALRAILNLAIKEDVYDSQNYPFKKYQIKTVKTISRAIDIQDINDINSLDKLNENQRHSRDIFLLIFSLIGISFMDLAFLKKENIINNRVIYTRLKTGKLYSVKLTPLAKKLIKKYNDVNSEYVLPQFHLEGKRQSKTRLQAKIALKSVNRYLKQIGKKAELPIPLTTYVARYSWAQTAKKEGYSKDLIAEALGHSYGNHVTGIYLDAYGNEVIDQAHENILSQLTIEQYEK